MMPDFGPQSGYIIASYAAAALILGAMIIASLIGRRAARQRMTKLESEAREP